MQKLRGKHAEWFNSRETWRNHHQQRIDQDYATVLIRDFLRQQLGFVVIKTPTTADQLEWDLQQVYSRTERLALERAYWRVMKDGDPL